LHSKILKQYSSFFRVSNIISPTPPSSAKQCTFYAQENGKLTAGSRSTLSAAALACLASICLSPGRAHLRKLGCPGVWLDGAALVAGCPLIEGAVWGEVSPGALIVGRAQRKAEHMGKGSDGSVIERLVPAGKGLLNSRYRASREECSRWTTCACDAERMVPDEKHYLESGE
jgi:hypothetical protein